MAKVYDDALDVHVRTNCFYAHTDNYLYTDSTHTTKVTAEEVMRAAKYGILITNAGGDFMIPVLVKNDGTNATVLCVSAYVSSATFSTYKSADIEGEE